MVGLAKLYRNGEGVKKYIGKALNLFNKTVFIGNKEAMNDLEFMYKYGVSVEQDLDKAKFWEGQANL